MGARRYLQGAWPVPLDMWLRVGQGDPDSGTICEAMGPWARDPIGTHKTKGSSVDDPRDALDLQAVRSDL